MQSDPIRQTTAGRQRVVDAAKALLAALEAIGRGDGSHADEVREIIESYEAPR